MLYICVDIEADGPSPHGFSMIELGAVVVRRDAPNPLWTAPALTKERGYYPPQEFFGQLAPVHPHSDPVALDAIGRTREQIDAYPAALTTMRAFAEWLEALKGTTGQNLKFVADNAGFDWMFVCDYLWRFTGRNDFGFSPMGLTSFYAGVERSLDMRRRGSFKKLRGNFPHTHNALDDAKGNAHALCTIFNMFGIDVP